jgi:prepilin-type N-terminal cleavage/methylation domain-containing protein
MKKAFTLVELLIVVAILGILAAIIVPEYQDHAQLAKEAVAKDNLRILRNAIELYAAQHNGIPPGYLNGDTGQLPIMIVFINQLQMATNINHQFAATGTAGYNLGPYVKPFPANPFNDKKTVVMITTEDRGTPTGENGWLYDPQLRTIKIDRPGTDSRGQNYSDY